MEVDSKPRYSPPLKHQVVVLSAEPVAGDPLSWNQQRHNEKPLEVVLSEVSPEGNWLAVPSLEEAVLWPPWGLQAEPLLHKGGVVPA